MRIKKVIAMLTATAMVFGLAACGNGKTNVGGKNEGGNEVSYDWSQGADASGGDVTLRVSTWRQVDEDYYNEIIRRFEEKYDWIDVQLEINSNASSYYTNLQADLISGVAPDVFECHSGSRVVDFAKEGLIAPQTDFSYLDRYKESSRLASSVDGVNYGCLFAYNYFGFIYNKDIFAKTGVEVPTTPDEFISVVNKLKSNGYGGAMVAGKTWGDAFGRAVMMSAIGPEKYTELRAGIDNGTITDITTVEGVKEALETMQAYADKDVFYDAFEGADLDSAYSLFAQEKTAICYTGSFIFGEKDNYFPDVDTGYFAIPTYANSGCTYAEGAQCGLINAASENLGAAKLWVEFVASQEISTYYCSNAKMLSSFEDVTPEFDEAEMLKSAATSYAIQTLEEFKNEEYWVSGFNSFFKDIIYEGQSWQAMLKMYTSQLEEYDLGNL